MSSNTNIDGTAVSAGQDILGSLSRQLHQTTQPLSVLQGLLELALIESHTLDDYRRSVETALQELSRVSDCFEELRRLICLYRSSDDEHPASEVSHV